MPSSSRSSGRRGSVDGLLVGEQTAHQPAELQQRVPVAAVTRESRRLHRQHDADASLADGEQQPLEPRTSATAAGPPEVVVDHHWVGPTQPAGTVCEPVLSPPALVMVPQLVSRRLPDVDEGLPTEMVRRDLAHRRSPFLVLPSPPSPAPALPPLRAAGSPPVSSLSPASSA